jgi:hypothetical protein
MRATTGLMIAVMAAVLAGSSVEAAQKTVLAIPARNRVVQFSQDIVRIRPVYLVSFAAKGSAGETGIYLWNASEESWKEISADEFTNGTVFDESARTLVWVGADKDMPSDIPSNPAWATKVEKIASLNPADMANGLDKVLGFSATEWRWLAKRYGLTITDLNAERRRYGKYGPPGAKKQPPAATRTSEEKSGKAETEDQLKVVPVPADEPAPVFDVKPVAPKVEEPAPVVQPPTPPPQPAAKKPRQNPADK